MSRLRSYTKRSCRYLHHTRVLRDQHRNQHKGVGDRRLEHVYDASGEIMSENKRRDNSLSRGEM